MQQYIIHIVELLGKDIRSRQRITSLVVAMNKPMIYMLDFTDVTFISRSFADELCSFIESYNKKIILVNLADEIKTMIDIVKENRNKPRHYTPGNVQTIDNMTDLEAFLNTI